MAYLPNYSMAILGAILFIVSSLHAWFFYLGMVKNSKFRGVKKLLVRAYFVVSLLFVIGSIIFLIYACHMNGAGA